MRRARVQHTGGQTHEFFSFLFSYHSYLHYVSHLPNHSTTFFSSSSQVVYWSAEIQTKVYDPRSGRPSEWIRTRSLNSYFAFCKIFLFLHSSLLARFRIGKCHSNFSAGSPTLKLTTSKAFDLTDPAQKLLYDWHLFLANKKGLSFLQPSPCPLRLSVSPSTRLKYPRNSSLHWHFY